MGIISIYAKRQFDDANKQLETDEQALLLVDNQIEELRKRKELLEAQIAKDRQNKVVKGMIYYSSAKRSDLLNRAEEMSYSHQTISRLREYNKDSWNADSVNINTIADFEDIEQFVNDNEPPWTRSPLSKLGQLFNNN